MVVLEKVLVIKHQGPFGPGDSYTWPVLWGSRRSQKAGKSQREGLLQAAGHMNRGLGHFEPRLCFSHCALSVLIDFNCFLQHLSSLTRGQIWPEPRMKLSFYLSSWGFRLGWGFRFCPPSSVPLARCCPPSSVPPPRFCLASSDPPPWCCLASSSVPLSRCCLASSVPPPLLVGAAPSVLPRFFGAASSVLPQLLVGLGFLVWLSVSGPVWAGLGRSGPVWAGLGRSRRPAGWLR